MYIYDHTACSTQSQREGFLLSASLSWPSLRGEQDRFFSYFFSFYHTLIMVSAGYTKSGPIAEAPAHQKGSPPPHRCGRSLRFYPAWSFSEKGGGAGGAGVRLQFTGRSQARKWVSDEVGLLAHASPQSWCFLRDRQLIHPTPCGTRAGRVCPELAGRLATELEQAVNHVGEEGGVSAWADQTEGLGVERVGAQKGRAGLGNLLTLLPRCSTSTLHFLPGLKLF